MFILIFKQLAGALLTLDDLGQTLAVVRRAVLDANSQTNLGRLEQVQCLQRVWFEPHRRSVPVIKEQKPQTGGGLCLLGQALLVARS